MVTGRHVSDQWAAQWEVLRIALKGQLSSPGREIQHLFPPCPLPWKSSLSFYVQTAGLHHVGVFVRIRPQRLTWREAAQLGGRSGSCCSGWSLWCHSGQFSQTPKQGEGRGIQWTVHREGPSSHSSFSGLFRGHGWLWVRLAHSWTESPDVTWQGLFGVDTCCPIQPLICIHHTGQV